MVGHMNNLAVKGELEVCGVTVPNINGGFGIDKKSMLAKHIAEIHEKKLIHVNEVINENIHRFKESIDVINIKSHDEIVIALTDNKILTKMQVSKAKSIYLLSERGYAKLIKLFNDDKSWELYDQMLDEYFDLREGNSNIEPINNTPMSQLEIAQIAINQLVQHEKKFEEMNNKFTRLETEFNKESTIEGYKSNDNLARKFNLFSANDKPHFGFLDAIAKHLRIYKSEIGYSDEYIKARREVLHGGTTGVAVYYSNKAIELISDFLKSEFKPTSHLYKRKPKTGQFNYADFTLGEKTYKFNEDTYKKYS
jgi:hypothetical protein